MKILPLNKYLFLCYNHHIQPRRLIMPTISMFYGIIIRMYCAPKEHNPPHFHAYYNSSTAVIDINKWSW